MTLMTRQAIATRVETTGAVAEANLDVGLYPSTKLEGVVGSSVAATFEVFGSIDGEVYRKTLELAVGAGEEKAFFLDNAYRYVKISTADVGDNLIEIAGGQG